MTPDYAVVLRPCMLGYLYLKSSGEPLTFYTTTKCECLPKGATWRGTLKFKPINPAQNNHNKQAGGAYAPSAIYYGSVTDALLFGVKQRLYMVLKLKRSF